MFIRRSGIDSNRWGAEVSGLLGSEYYVSQLSEEDLGAIALNLNFDMIGSPNYVRFSYDGDGSISEPIGPEVSEVIKWMFNDYFTQAWPDD